MIRTGRAGRGRCGTVGVSVVIFRMLGEPKITSSDLQHLAPCVGVRHMLSLDAGLLSPISPMLRISALDCAPISGRPTPAHELANCSAASGIAAIASLD